MIYRFGAFLTMPTRLFYQKTHTGPTPLENRRFRYDLLPILKDAAFKVVYVVTGLFIFDSIACAIVGLGLIGIEARGVKSCSLLASKRQTTEFQTVLENYHSAFNLLQTILGCCEDQGVATTGKTYFEWFTTIRTLINNDTDANKHFNLSPKKYEELDKIWNKQLPLVPFELLTSESMSEHQAIIDEQDGASEQLIGEYKDLYIKAYTYFNERLKSTKDAYTAFLDTKPTW